VCGLTLLPPSDQTNCVIVAHHKRVDFHCRINRKEKFNYAFTKSIPIIHPNSHKLFKPLSDTMRLLILSLLSLVTLQASLACTPSGVQVSLLGNPKTTANIYSSDDVFNHARDNVDVQSQDYRNNRRTTLACVDARADEPVVGTPGGDLAEFIGGLTTYFNLTNTQPTVESIRSIFQKFVRTEISKQRPLYFHTDDTRMRMVFEQVGAKIGRKVVILPEQTPANETEASTWLDELTKPYAQGCGHLRLMLNQSSDYGLSSDFIPKATIRVFYEQWWNASAEGKAQYDLEVKLGPLIGKAIAVVSNAGPGCQDKSLAVQPSLLGSSLFVYHPDAAAEFRNQVLTPFFVKLDKPRKLTESVFALNLNNLLQNQLGATLTYLAPAKDVNLYSVTYTSRN
jgi:hypothetical protein